MSGSSVDLSNSQTGGLHIDLTANNGDINTQGATTVTPGTLSVTAQANAQQTWNNSKASTPGPNPTSTPTIQAGQLAVSVANLNNQGATIVQTGTGAASITLTAAQGTLNNSAGTIAANATDLTLGAATLNNAGGSIRHAGNGVLTVNAGTISGNSGSVVSNGAMNLNASGAVDLQNATSIAQQVSITAASLTNQGGRIVQTSSTRPAANIVVTGALDNTGGFVGSNGALQINAGSITNANGQITALQSLGLTSSGLLSNRASTSSGAPNNVAGLIQSNGALSVQAASLDNTGATVSSAQGDVSINTSGQTNNTAGKITAAGDVNLTSSSLLNGNAGLLGANGALNLNSDSVQNGGGQIVSAGNVTVTGKSGASSAAALLDNTSGLVQSGATLRVNAGQIVNTATYTPPTSTATALGLLGKDIQLAANSLDNHNGEVLAGNNLNIQATQSIDNSQSGLLYAGKALKVQDSAQLANPAAARTLQVSNANGVLNAGTSNQVQAAGLSGTGQLLSQGDLSLDVSSDFNNSGTVNANGNTTLTSTGTVTNSGTLAAGKTLTVAAINLNNAASGKLSGAAGTNVLLTGTLNNRGLIDSGNSTGTSLTLIKAQTVNNLGTGRIYGDNVAIAANTLTNDVETVAGVTKTAVIASRNRLDIGAGTLNNANGATILSLGDMSIGGALDTSNHATGAAGTVTNSASQIQSVNGNLAINTGTLQNLNPTFSYQVVGGTPSAEKTEYILTNGQVVQDSQVAVDNGLLHTYTRAGGETAPYGKVLLNSDPLATSANAIVYKASPVYTPSGENCVVVGGHGGHEVCTPFPATYSQPSDASVWATVGMTTPGQGDNVAASTYIELQNRMDALRSQMDSHMLTVQAYSAYTSATEQAVVSGGTPGTISSGGTITINASNSARNDNSQILAGGALVVNVPGGQLDNTSTNVTVHNDKAGYNFNWACVNFRGTSTCGVAYYNQFNLAGQPDLRQNPFTQSIPTTVQVSNSQALQYTSINAPVTQPAAATGGGGVVVASLPGQVSSVSQPALTAAQSGGTGVGNTAGPLTSKTSASSAQATSNPATRIASTTPSFKLPNSSLYQINNSPTAQYLVQTDPAFTSYQTWLSSDYVTSQVRLDPTVTQKRLGDGFYEQQLVREQVAQLTGRRFLGNYTSDQQEYQALMDSGLTFAKVQKLSPGIALSAAQIASLTSDIVWLEQQTVTLADGSTTQAIVPHVYAAIREGDLAPSGALLGGNSVAINTGGDVNNSGTIAGRKLVQISANSINNSVSSIDGQSVSLNAVQDINNIGGAVIADTNLALQAGRDINVTSTTQSSAGAGGNYSFSESGIDRVATLYTRGPGVLLASAGNNINLTAAQLSSGGDVQISAANNLTLSTITSSQSNNFGAGNADNHFLSSNSKEVGTTIQSAGNTALAAGNTLSATAANVNATGDLALSAKNIALLAGTSKASSDTVMTNSSSDMFSSSTTVTKESQASTSAVATAIGGRNVTINSQNDITVKASNVLADNNVSLAAGNNVNIVAGVNTQNTSSFTQKSESGFLSGGGLGVTYGSRNQSLDQKDATTTAATSTVGSIGGNVSINAGKTYTQSGSDVLTQGGNIDIAATNVKIEESRQTGRSQTQTKFEQSGISVGLSGGVIDTLQTTAQGLQGALTSGSNRNKALNALIAYGKGSDLVEQGKAVENAYNQNGVMGSEGNPGAAAASGIKVSISIGSSSSQSDSNTAANTAAASTVKAGGNVSIRASGQGQGEGDLTVQGSKVEAAGNTTLSATQNVNIVASADTVSNRSTNSSSADSLGVSFGVGKGSAGLSVDASASRGQGQANSDNVSYNNSLISAANKVSITSGADTNIAGGNVTAKEISATVGGNLNITSLQDNAKSNASQSTTGVSVGIPIGPGSASFSASQANQNSNTDYKSVNQQSGISAGDGGFQINVAGNTDLKGAVIASTNKAVQDGKNSLTTKTLTTSDLQNSMSGSASSSGTSVGTDMLQGKYNLAKTIVGNAINNGSANQSDASTAKSAISAAQVTVGGVTTDTGKAQLTDSNGKAVSTDTTSTNRTLSKADVAGLQSQAQQQQADNMLLFQSLKMVGDKIYRKETEAKKLVQMTCAAANKEQCSATEVGIAQVKSVEKIVTAFNNGMLSTEQNALLTAYMQATGSQLQNGVLVIVNPQANDMVSEGAWVVWKKIEQVFGFGTSSAGQLNLALEAIAATQNAKVDTIDHSAGNFAVAERNRVLQDQGTTNAAIGTQTMFGSPVNAQDQANQVSAITNGEGTVQQATQQNDFVGRWFSLSATQGASNPATPSQTGSLGNPNVGGVEAHTAYTGDLTTSTSKDTQVPSIEKSPFKIREATDTVWDKGGYSQPKVVTPKAVQPQAIQSQQP
jgi:filamentous hemagglutinin